MWQLTNINPGTATSTTISTTVNNLGVTQRINREEAVESPGQTRDPDVYELTPIVTDMSSLPTVQM